MTMHEKYNITGVYMGGNYIIEHRGKDIKHIEYFIKFIDGTEISVFVPHYFEQVGTERLFIKEIQKNKLKQRSIKIQKLKQKTL